MYSSLRLARGPRVSKVICVRGGILDSVMRENISFVLTGFRAVSLSLFSEEPRELFEAIEGQVVKGAR
jgi:hypothetical protein